MLATATSATPWGVEERAVEVQVEAREGLPSIHLVGLPEVSRVETRERVRSAIRNGGFTLPTRSIIVSLSPYEMTKAAHHLDLAVALATMEATGEIPVGCLTSRLLVGALGLDSSVLPIRGGLALAEMAVRQGMREVILPFETAREAVQLGEVPVVGVRTLAEAVGHVTGERPLAPMALDDAPEPVSTTYPCLSKVRGQYTAKKALEMAAAGGHNVLLMGPPGSGKTMLARCFPGLLPPLTRDESLEVTKIYSRTGNPPTALVTRPPFRAPHPGISRLGLVGGGPRVHLGELSLAHHGVLVLDEIPSFVPGTLGGLTKPLDEGEVELSVDPGDRLTLPSQVTVIATMGPCPCGYLGEDNRDCECHWEAIERYRSRVPGSLRDRFELHADLIALPRSILRGQGGGETTEEIREKVTAARTRQLERQGVLNARLPAEELEDKCGLDPTGREILGKAFEALGLSGRAAHQVMRVARTLADLEGRELIGAEHVGEAVQYRALERRSDDEG